MCSFSTKPWGTRSVSQWYGLLDAHPSNNRDAPNARLLLIGNPPAVGDRDHIGIVGLALPDSSRRRRAMYRLVCADTGISSSSMIDIQLRVAEPHTAVFHASWDESETRASLQLCC